MYVAHRLLVRVYGLGMFLLCVSRPAAAATSCWEGVAATTCARDETTGQFDDTESLRALGSHLCASSGGPDACDSEKECEARRAALTGSVADSASRRLLARRHLLFGGAVGAATKTVQEANKAIDDEESATIADLDNLASAGTALATFLGGVATGLSLIHI